MRSFLTGHRVALLTASIAAAAVGVAGACTFQLADVRVPDAGGAGGDGGSSGAGACPDGGDAVGAFVVSQTTSGPSTLYSFVPPTDFHQIGVINCGGSGAPWDMAVAQDGTVWIVLDTGELAKVSTVDASCTRLSYFSNQSGFVLFALAFERSSTVDSEKLFASDTTYRSPLYKGYDASNGIATLDTTSLVLSPLGKLPSPYSGLGAELSGTGDGRLYAFIPQLDDAGTAVLAQVDVRIPLTLHTITTPASFPLVVPTNGDFAFLFWHEDFYLFIADVRQNSTIWRYGSLTNKLDNFGTAPFAIIGAGASTCTPVGGD